MSVTQFPPKSSGSVQPIGATGTYTLAKALTPGLYRITTDTSQTFTTAQLYFQTAQGFRFGAAVRGGQGYVAVPETVTSVTLSSGTFPLLIGFEPFASYSLIAAPTNIAFDYALATGAPYTALMSFTAPAGATSIGVYWADGTFTDLATTTSPATVTLPTAPTFDNATPALIVAKDANGVFGLGSVNTSKYLYSMFTTSGTFTRPSGYTTGDILVVGGGGGGGYVGSGRQLGGGGGGGQVVYLTNQTLPATATVTIGAAGLVGSTATAGGSSAFASTTAAGGGRGGGGGAAPSTGSSGGGGRGGSQAGAAGTAGQGYAGGTGATYGGGAGGGAGGAGANGGTGNAFNGGAAAAALTYFGVAAFGRGGGGGGADGSATGGGAGGGAGGSTYGGGGGGATGFFSTTYGDTYYAGANGTPGVVIVKITG